MDISNLVLGRGQIGTAIAKVLATAYRVDTYDQTDNVEPPEKYAVLHICFGHKKDEVERFIAQVEDYKQRFLKPEGLVVIHSTVSIGVSRRLEAVHSGTRGMHPHLEQGIRTFTKFFGGDRASEAAELFRRCGVTVQVFNEQEASELGKLSETTFYALMIEYVKELKRKCDELNLSFTEVYTIQANAYREGWANMGHPEYTMPIIAPLMFPQQGHCTIPNLELWDFSFNELIKKQNAK